MLPRACLSESVRALTYSHGQGPGQRGPTLGAYVAIALPAVATALCSLTHATATVSQDNKPKPAAKPMKKGSAYVALAGEGRA
jgi:hypothetical protein